MQQNSEEKLWLTIAEIQEKYLPISKKAIRKLVNENLDVTRTGNKMLVERQQLENFLRKNI